MMTVECSTHQNSLLELDSIIPRGLTEQEIAALASLVHGACELLIAGRSRDGSQTAVVHLAHAYVHVKKAHGSCYGNLSNKNFLDENSGRPHVQHALARMVLAMAEIEVLKI